MYCTWLGFWCINLWHWSRLAVGYWEFHLVWHGWWHDWNIAYFQVASHWSKSSVCNLLIVDWSFLELALDFPKLKECKIAAFSQFQSYWFVASWSQAFRWAPLGLRQSRMVMPVLLPVQLLCKAQPNLCAPNLAQRPCGRAKRKLHRLLPLKPNSQCRAWLEWIFSLLKIYCSPKVATS